MAGVEQSKDLNYITCSGDWPSRLEFVRSAVHGTQRLATNSWHRRASGVRLGTNSAPAKPLNDAQMRGGLFLDRQP